MCGGHNHVKHNVPFGYSSHRAAEPVYRPVDQAPVTTPCPECDYPVRLSSRRSPGGLCPLPPVRDAVAHRLPRMSPGREN